MQRCLARGPSMPGIQCLPCIHPTSCLLCQVLAQVLMITTRRLLQWPPTCQTRVAVLHTPHLPRVLQTMRSAGRTGHVQLELAASDTTKTTSGNFDAVLTRLGCANCPVELWRPVCSTGVSQAGALHHYTEQQACAAPCISELVIRQQGPCWRS